MFRSLYKEGDIMNKLLCLIVFILLISIVGCKQSEVIKTDNSDQTADSADTTQSINDIESDIADIDALDEDLDMSNLDDLDKDLADIENIN